MPIGVPKDTFFSAYYRARTPEFLLEPKAYGLWVDFFSQYLLMKERAPVIVRILLNRVITQQVRRAFAAKEGFSYSKLIHNLIQIGLLYFIYENMSIFSVYIHDLFLILKFEKKNGFLSFIIFDPEPEEVVFLCILSMFYIFNKKVLTLSVLWKNRTHDAPISLFHYEWYACDNNDKIFLILIVRAYCGDSFERIKSIEILLIQKGEIFVIVLSTGATERYILFLYPFLDYMRPKTRNDKKKKITIRFQIEKLQSFRFVRGDKKRGTIYL
ncbi:hypothetical protein ACJX0J_000048 [Zea mays]